MKTGPLRYRDILLTCLAGAMFFFTQSARAQDFHPVPTGADTAAAAAAAEKEDREYRLKDRPDRFTYGKRHETSVTTESASNTIQKTKHGTSDATVPTGVFKESFIDVGLSSARAPAPAPSATPKAQFNPIRSASTSVQSSASPQPSPAATVAPALTAPTRLDITLGVSPAPNVAVTPKPH